jgi:hypothetical protein
MPNQVLDVLVVAPATIQQLLALRAPVSAIAEESIVARQSVKLIGPATAETPRWRILEPRIP